MVIYKTSGNYHKGITEFEIESINEDGTFNYKTDFGIGKKPFIPVFGNHQPYFFLKYKEAKLHLSKRIKEEIKEAEALIEKALITFNSLYPPRKHPPMTKKEIVSKLRSIKLSLTAHPDNEPNSEFADRIDSLDEIIDELSAQIQEEKSKESNPDVSWDLKNADSLKEYIFDDLIGVHKNAKEIDEAINQYAEVYHEIKLNRNQ